MRATSFLAMAVFLGATGVLAAPLPVASTASVVPRARSFEAMRLGLETASVPSVDASSFEARGPKALSGIVVWNRNTNARDTIRLYDDRGVLDLAAARAFMNVAGSAHDDVAGKLDVRLVRLVLRASYRFGGAAVAIISGTRRGANGRHGTGEALDFSLEGVSAGELASFLRATPRAGVGIYTHPKTQYVHLDVRAHSYHWIDASPPGVTWREKLLPDPTQAERDGSYVPAMDLPDIR